MPDLAEPLMVKYLHEKGVREGIPVSCAFGLQCDVTATMTLQKLLKNKRNFYVQ